MPPTKGGAPIVGMKQVQTGMKITGMRQASQTGMRQYQADHKCPVTITHKAKGGKIGKVGKASLPLSGNKVQDEALKKLRIPFKICKALPSVRKFSSHGKRVSAKQYETDQGDNSPDLEIIEHIRGPSFLGVRRKRGELSKYALRMITEEKFPGMIWDIAFAPSGEVVVSTSEGAFFCDESLQERRKLDNVVLAGGIGFLSDERILVVCRNFDVVNIFTPSGTFIRSFPAGMSPVALTVNSDDEILITDTATKSLRFYDPSGTLLRTIETNGPNYRIAWPLYAALNGEGDILVSDSHLQEVLVFGPEGKYKGLFPLKTQGANVVLKPHGVCVNNEDDTFLVDHAINSLEVFQNDGTYMQTLLTSEEGAMLRPKVVRTNASGKMLLLGGLTGLIRLYEFIEGPDLEQATAHVAATTIVKKEPEDIIILE